LSTCYILLMLAFLWRLRGIYKSRASQEYEHQGKT
jgi:hypothetical protein